MPDDFENVGLKDITISAGWIILTLFLGTIDIIELIGVVLNITGVWGIVVIAVNIFAIFIVLLWRTMTEGLSFSAIFGSWKGLIFLLADQVPVVGDVFPGLILFMLGIRKKKTKPVNIKGKS